MINFRKKEVLTPRQRQIKRLKEDLRYCETQIKRTTMLFELATDENLIEARIYELKSLSKHHDYLTSSIKKLMLCEEEKRTINV